MTEEILNNYRPQGNLFKTVNCDGICRICNKKFKNGSALSTHLHRAHNITFKIYLKQYYNIDVDELNLYWKQSIEKRKIDKKVINKNKPRYSGVVPINKLINFDFKCKICQRIFKNSTFLSTHVVNTHKITMKAYLYKFYNIDIDKINKKWREGKNDRIKAGYIKMSQTKKGRKKTQEEKNNIKMYMKGVFTLEWYINKYGVEKGKKMYYERNKNLSKNTYWIDYNKKNKKNWSKISQELFWELYASIKDKYSYIYFGELNHEYGCETNQNYDFVIKDNKKIIEFYGDKFHANPAFFNENEVPIVFLEKRAKEIWKDDEEKNIKAIKNGYKIKIIWENDFINNREKIIHECLFFINE